MASEGGDLQPAVPTFENDEDDDDSADLHPHHPNPHFLNCRPYPTNHLFPKLLGAHSDTYHLPLPQQGGITSACEGKGGSLGCTRPQYRAAIYSPPKLRLYPLTPLLQEQHPPYKKKRGRTKPAHTLSALPFEPLPFSTFSSSEPY